MPRILLIEDDERLAAMVESYLVAAGFAIGHAPSGEAALRDLRTQVSDVILLDLMLPDGDGLDLFRAMRALPGGRGAVPVIMVTARGDPMDRVIGLEVGADDYLPKPFEPRELLARIRAVLRRASATASGEDILRFGRLEVDRGARMARLDGDDAHGAA